MLKFNIHYKLLHIWIKLSNCILDELIEEGAELIDEGE
jgi:hypothetical protein